MEYLEVYMKCNKVSLYFDGDETILRLLNVYVSRGCIQCEEYGGGHVAQFCIKNEYEFQRLISKAKSIDNLIINYHP